MAEPTQVSYCAREVRRYDHDRYLTCLFAPAARREALFALYAFNLEVAKTAEVVSEAMLGRIRLQWWREAIEEVYQGRARQHEVVTPLAGAISAHGLSRASFERLIDGREFDLEGEPPATLERLEAYAEATSASLLQLALGILGTGDDEASLEAGREVGIAWALIGLLRAVPFHARQKRLYLPQDLAGEAGLGVGDLFELRSSDALRQVVRQVASGALERLARAKARRAQVPKRARPALMLATLAARHGQVLAKAGFDPFAPTVRAAAPGSIWRLAGARLRGRF